MYWEIKVILTLGQHYKITNDRPFTNHLVDHFGLAITPGIECHTYSKYRIKDSKGLNSFLFTLNSTWGKFDLLTQ